MKKEEVCRNTDTQLYNIKSKMFNVILYSGATWRKLNNNNRHCNITAS